MRALLFVVAFLVGLALSAPLERWVLPLLAKPLAASGIELRLDKLRIAFPAGLEATGFAVEGATGSIEVDSLYVGITRYFHAEACGGTAEGRVSRQSVELSIRHFDPSRCIRFGKFTLESVFDGSVRIDDASLLPPKIDLDTTADFDIRSVSGTFGGVIPHAGPGGADLPLGEWDFSDLVLRASLAGGKLDVAEGHAVTNGVEWQLLGAGFKQVGAKSDVRIDFRARQVGETARGKALLGLLPKASQDKDGWRSYRVVGAPGSMHVLGLD